MDSLLNQLRDETGLLDLYLAALEHTDDVLAQGRFAELPALTARMNALREHIAAADEAREASLRALGFSADKAGARAAAATSEPVAHAWGAVLERADRARQLTVRVAAKVYTNLEFTGNALAFLRSRAKPLYGPNGSRESAAGGTTLAVG